MERVSGIQNEIIEGRNAVIEALRAGRAIDKLFINKGEVDKTLGHIASKARDKGIVVVECDRRKLDFMSQTHAHQGVIAVCAVREYCSVDDIFAIAEARGETPFVIVCDEISDPHNLGAIIRTAECVGAHGVIIPKRRSAGLTATLAVTRKCSSPSGVSIASRPKRSITAPARCRAKRRRTGCTSPVNMPNTVSE